MVQVDWKNLDLLMILYQNHRSFASFHKKFIIGVGVTRSYVKIKNLINPIYGGQQVLILIYFVSC
jgi:hypothetical protein